MSSEKKYYWLKLKDDFFSSKRIKKLRKMAGGDTYLIIYLKMQLKALKTDGVLQWTGLESDFADELALDIDEEPDNVKVTLAYLMSCGLIETSDAVNFLLPYAIANTGAETAVAERVRRHRENQRLLQCNTAETISNTEIEIEKDKEIEKEKEPKKRGVFQEFAGGDKELLKALREFNDFRNAKKKPMTDGAKERLCKRLEAFPKEQWIALLQQSIDKGWIDIYPLNGTVEAKADKYAAEASYKNAITELLNG